MSYSNSDFLTSTKYLFNFLLVPNGTYLADFGAGVGSDYVHTSAAVDAWVLVTAYCSTRWCWRCRMLLFCHVLLLQFDSIDR